MKNKIRRGSRKIKDIGNTKTWKQYSIMAMRLASSTGRCGFDSHYCQRDIYDITHRNATQPHQLNFYNNYNYLKLSINKLI